MCGIFALLNNKINNNNNNNNTNENIYLSSVIRNQFEEGFNRGPDDSKFIQNDKYNYNLGFHRLAINGLNDISNQPISIDNVTLICNGEIYNYKQLYKYMNIEAYTGSDCEVIIHMYIKYGIEQTLRMLDGVFGFVLIDSRIQEDALIYIARDPFGVRPVYLLEPKINTNTSPQVYGFASELKCLEYFYNSFENMFNLNQFKPGTFLKLKYNNFSKQWNKCSENVTYFIPSFSSTRLVLGDGSELTEEFYNNINQYLFLAVKKRCLATERPVACLLSGGLDSSLIASLVANHFREQGKQIETFSIGLKESEDLKYAKIASEWIGSKHTEIIVTEEEMFDAIPKVIEAIESYDTTTIRASIGNYLLGKYISENSEAKVIFNGDGSDELFGGYLYMNQCPDDIEFDNETRRLLKDIHLFDVLRSDKCISSHGLEPRTPFLDRSFVNYILSIPPYFRNHKNFIGNKTEKFLLRNSFSKEYFLTYEGKQILPDEILWRKKEAFSDGVSSKGRSLYQILQEKIMRQLNSEMPNMFYTVNIQTEKIYYKRIFDEFYANCSHVVPYYWMPKYIESNDPSARTLNIYT
jgi:asparagine synthase (glutamine-hydrolysing)